MMEKLKMLWKWICKIPLAGWLLAGIVILIRYGGGLLKGVATRARREKTKSELESERNDTMAEPRKRHTDMVEEIRHRAKERREQTAQDHDARRKEWDRWNRR